MRSLFLGLIFCLIGVCITFYIAYRNNDYEFRYFCAGSCAAIAFLFGVMIMPAETDTTEYVPAVIACQNEFSTYFHDISSGHIFHVETNPSYTDDRPYLLDVETHGTESKLDDEVLVVWRTD